MLYIVELKRVSYETMRIEASSPEEAERLAWDELRTDASYGMKYGEWECCGIYEDEE